MQVYNVGPDQLRKRELNFLRPEQYHWLVYSYTDEGWTGDGEAVAFGKDGLLYYASLASNSYWGPLSRWDDWNDSMTPKEFLGAESILDWNFTEPVRSKVTELLGR